jgi:hypothetical protein
MWLGVIVFIFVTTDNGERKWDVGAAVSTYETEASCEVGMAKLAVITNAASRVVAYGTGCTSAAALVWKKPPPLNEDSPSPPPKGKML